jgi:hypothetical protein
MLTETPGNDTTVFDDSSWQIEALQMPLSPRATPELFSIDDTSSWGMINGGPDHSSSLSDQSYLDQDPTDGPAIDLDFDVDEYLSTPGMLFSNALPLEPVPIDKSSDPGQLAMCSSPLFLQNTSHAQPSPCNEFESIEPASNHSALANHQCTTCALRILEMSMAGPKTPVAVEDLLRFLANAKSGARSLAKLTRCTTCMNCSPFLVLMVININALLDGVEQTFKMLSDHSCRAEASVWITYGVDNAEEFGRMYSPLLLPVVGALRTVISEINQVCLTQSLQPQLETLEKGWKRLETLGMDLRGFL